MYASQFCALYAYFDIILMAFQEEGGFGSQQYYKEHKVKKICFWVSFYRIHVHVFMSTMYM